MRLLGHLEEIAGRHARFADDLAETVAWGDARRADFLGLVRKLVAHRGLPEPELPEPEPLRVEPLRELDLTGFGAVVVTAGFRPAYTSWVDAPVPRLRLSPLHDGCASTAAPACGCGRRALPAPAHARRCSAGVGDDAAIVARGIAAAA